MILHLLGTQWTQKSPIEHWVFLHWLQVSANSTECWSHRRSSSDLPFTSHSLKNIACQGRYSSQGKISSTSRRQTNHHRLHISRHPWSPSQPTCGGWSSKCTRTCRCSRSCPRRRKWSWGWWRHGRSTWLLHWRRLSSPTIIFYICELVFILFIAFSTLLRYLFWWLLFKKKLTRGYV